MLILLWEPKRYIQFLADCVPGVEISRGEKLWLFRICDGYTLFLMQNSVPICLAGKQ